MTARRNLICASTAALLALGAAAAAPALAQGAYQSPAAPNANNSMPQSANSVPPGARTLEPGTTGSQRTGTIGTARVQNTAKKARAAR